MRINFKHSLRVLFLIQKGILKDMQYTENLKLKKPESSDFYSVNDFNDNFDELDNSLKIHYYDGIRQEPSQNKSDFKNIKKGDIAVEKTTGVIYQCEMILNENVYWGKLMTEALVNAILKEKDANEDTGWVIPSRGIHTDPVTHAPHLEFPDYSETSPLRIRRIGKIVHLQGIIKNYHEISASEQDKEVFSIKEEFRPSQRLIFVQQGSGANKFILIINTDGQCSIGRYSNNATTANTIPENSWLNCFATWMVD